MVRSPAMHDGFRPEDWSVTRTPTQEELPPIQTHIPTSDESSCGTTNVAQRNGTDSSPRRHRRIRDISRRKPAPTTCPPPTKSPITQPHRTRRRSGSVECKTITLTNTGSLPRRRQSIQPQMQTEDHEKPTRLSPHRFSKSPGGSPRKIRKTIEAGEVKLKAVSAESLRSVSPGSDSVFYNETGAAMVESHHQCVHCLHCGKEVDIVTTEDLDEHMVKQEPIETGIVRPPADFADSPDGPRTKHGRLYKKLDKRFRSEERGHGERRHHHRYRQDVRAKVRYFWINLLIARMALL